jgi:hypothetical protein
MRHPEPQWKRTRDPLEYVRTRLSADNVAAIEAEIEQVLRAAEVSSHASEVAKLDVEGEVNAVC